MAVDYQIISEISIKEKARVYLVTKDGEPTFYVLKRYVYDHDRQVFQQLKDLPAAYFPQIVDLWKEDEEICIVEEYIEGRTLREIINHDDITVNEAIQYMTMLCKAMGILHNHKPKLIHRDIKPENILIDKAGHLKLIDYDSVRIYKPETSYDTVLLGTREYASPEQFGFQQTDERSDIYSAGVVLKELVLKLDLDAGTARKIQKISDKATMFEPGKRYRNVEGMLADIQQIGKRSRAVWAAAFITASIVFVLAGWGFRANMRRLNDIEQKTTEGLSEAETIGETGGLSEAETLGETEGLSEAETSGETEGLSEAETSGETEGLSEAETLSETETTDSSDNIINDDGAATDGMEAAYEADRAAIYHWSDDHWSFWGFEDDAAYPAVFYLASEREGWPVSEIGNYALSNKEELREMHIPESVTVIGKDAFQDTDLVIYGKAGSYIEEFCRLMELRFVAE